MLWIYLIVLVFLLFAGLMFFLWYVLKRNYVKSTGALQALSKDIVSKEEEAKRILQSAQKEAKTILAKETQTAQETKEKLVKEAEEQKVRILLEANQKGDEIAEKAQRNADFLQKELDQRIDKCAREKLFEMIRRVIPEEFLKDIHQKWVSEADKDAFNLQHLKLPDNIKEAKIVSAFPLTDKQQGDLRTKFKKKFGGNVAIKTEVDSALIAGFAITIGSVVVDVSLKYKIQKAMQE